MKRRQTGNKNNVDKANRNLAFMVHLMVIGTESALIGVESCILGKNIKSNLKFQKILHILQRFSYTGDPKCLQFLLR